MAFLNCFERNCSQTVSALAIAGVCEWGSSRSIDNTLREIEKRWLYKQI